MGDVNNDDLRQLRAQYVQALAEIDAFYTRCARDLAARFLAKVIPRTPVGDYPSGKVGGTLRRGWTAQSHGQAETGEAAEPLQYAQSLKVEKRGGTYTLMVENPVHYASYVEYGHRKRGGKGWVEGRFMLTFSENELAAITPQILEKQLKRWLEEVMDDD